MEACILAVRMALPLAVFGPQVSYFAPGILMQEDLH